MDVFATFPSDLSDAVRDFLLAEHQKELAEALRQRAADLAAAGNALRALTQAAEELTDSETDAWSLQQRFPALLAAHQTTWGKAFKSGLDGHFTELVRDLFGHKWRQIFLPVLLDRSFKHSGIVDYGHMYWVRIFGRPRRESKSWVVFCSDGWSTARVKLSYSRASLMKGPLWLVAELSKRALQMQAREAISGDDYMGQEQRTVYDYSPIGEQDLSIRIEAMRDIAASVSYMEKLISNDAFVSGKDPFFTREAVFALMGKYQISTADFHRALGHFYQISRSSIEMARARYKRAQKGKGQATQQSARPQKNSAAHSQKTHVAVRKRRTSRREDSTP